MIVKCEFQIRTNKDPMGNKLLKSRLQDCGCAGAMFSLTGELSTIKMPLCDKHQKFCAQEYGWKVVPIQS